MVTTIFFLNREKKDGNCISGASLDCSYSLHQKCQSEKNGFFSCISALVDFIAIQLFFEVKQQMGGNWGIIHNQSKEDMIYLLHHQELTEQEATTTKKIGAQATASMSGVGGGIDGNYSEEIKKVSEKIDCVYTLQAKRMTKVGLEDVDFKKIRFMTITSGGKNIMESGKISCQEDLRIKILPEQGYKLISKQEAEKLKKVYEGITVETGKCPECSEPSACKELKAACKRCSGQHEDLWVCRVNPTRHQYCQECCHQIFVQKEHKGKQ